jgi:hypothetical protein
MGQLVVLTVLRCSPAGTVAGGSPHPGGSLGGANHSVGAEALPAALAGMAAHNRARQRGMLVCSKWDAVTLTSDPPLATCCW